jgi:hypothetical protein
MKDSSMSELFPTKPPFRDDKDIAEIAQGLESVPGQVQLDAVIKAQMSVPQIVERMVKLENCVWHLASAIVLLPDTAIDPATRRKLIEEARPLLLESKILNHNLELQMHAPADRDDGEITTLFPRSRSI